MTATPDPPIPGVPVDDGPMAALPPEISSGGGARPPQRRSVSSVAPAPEGPVVAAAAPVVVQPSPADPSAPTTAGSTTTRSRRTRRPTPRPEARPAVAPAPAVRAERRFRHTITKVDLWTVLKLSLCFYLSAMFVTLIALVALWVIADAAGVIGSIENFFGDLLSAKDFTFLSGEVLRGAILVSLVVVALQVVITVIAASFYNIFAELFGGLELTVREEETGVA